MFQGVFRRMGWHARSKGPSTGRTLGLENEGFCASHDEGRVKCQIVAKSEKHTKHKSYIKISHNPPASSPCTRGNATKIPSPQMDPAERPTDPGRRGKEGSKGGIKKEPNAQVICRKNLDFFPDGRQTPARREARNHRSEDAEMLGGPLPLIS